ncbi:MAG: TetR/AcrR family transcriptional regulator [Acidimicrobiales bacterium]
MSQGQRRKQLASKAKEAFLEGGYRGTTTKDVAKAAGVSEALIVKHFGSKEELFRHSMIDPLLGMLTEAVQREPRAGDDVLGQWHNLHDFYLGWARIVQEQGPLLWAVLRESQDFPDIAQSIAGLFRSHVEEVAQALTLRLDRDQFREFDAEVATYVGLGAATTAGFVGGDPEPFVTEVVNLFFWGVLTPAGRRALEAEGQATGAPTSGGATTEESS